MSIIQGTSKAAGGAGYEIDQSIRFNKTDNSGLTVTPSAGNRDLFTLSVWFKLGLVTSTEYRTLFCADTSNTFQISFLPTANGDYLRFQDNGVRIFDFSQSLRDPSAWYHLVYAYDSAQATAADRCKAYLNGEEVTALTGVAYPAQNVDSKWNSAVVHGLGYRSATDNWDGYLAEIHHIEGTALDPTSFGEYNDDGVWIPKAYTGSYGTNGFYITGETASDLGEDFSGNGNDFTSSGLATTDQMSDTPTLNYPTLNSDVLYQAGLLLSDGNLDAFGSSGSNWNLIPATMQIPPTGKWAFECTILSVAGYINIGFASAEDINNFQGSLKYFPLMQNAGWLNYSEVVKKVDGSSTYVGGLGSLTTNDVVECMIDNDAGTMTFLKNGSAYASLSGLNPLTQPAIGVFTNGVYRAKVDFGQIDYVPSDSSYSAINSSTLPTPSITDGSAHFQPTLYTGTGSTQSIDQSGNSTFQPDFVWWKNRTDAAEHMLGDAVRGAGKVLRSNNAAAELDDSAVYFSSFDSDGFTVGTANVTNGSGDAMVAWQWKANGAGSSNTDGSINTTATSVNTTAGFSISTYTGNATVGATVGHGLGIAPKVVIVKNRTGASTESWVFGHDSVGWTKAMYMQSTVAPYTLDIYWNNTAPTSSVVTLHDHPVTNGSSYTYVMYAFAEIPGYSSFGIYTGNGSSNGPFVYTGGFKPAFVLIKRTNAAENWLMMDSTRYPNNPANNPIFANTTNADANGGRPTDFLSNGFKPRNTLAGMNASGSTYIYMAFAENPFGGDGVAPATAR